MAAYAYESNTNSSSSEQDLINKTFESMENQPPMQTGWLGTPVSTSSIQQPMSIGTHITQPMVAPQPVYLPQPVMPPIPASTLAQQPSQIYPSQAQSGWWLGQQLPERRETFYPKTSSILSSKVPFELTQEGETVTVLGETGVLANKEDIINWSGPIPLSEYPINEDPSPEVIIKKSETLVTYPQEIAVRYLRPPTPPTPGDIIIKQEKSFVPPPAPPLVIRQQPSRPLTPQPLVYREAPPQPLPRVETKVIVIPGKRVPPPPRKVIIERLAPLPAKPQAIIVERWLPYREQKRRVVFQKSSEPEAYYEKPKNVIIQWEAPNVAVNREFRDLGVVRANPEEYRSIYGDSLKRVDELPDFVRSIRPVEGIYLASEVGTRPRLDLEGDVFALSLIDLDREGLGEYRDLLSRTSFTQPSAPQSQFPVQPTQFPVTHAQQIQTAFQQPAQHPLAPAQQTQLTLQQPSLYPITPVQQIQAPYRTPDTFISNLVNQIITTVKIGSKDKVDFSEAKNIIRSVNERLNRKYEESQAEKFLESINLRRDGTLDLHLFKDALLRNLQFYSIFMF